MLGALGLLALAGCAHTPEPLTRVDLEQPKAGAYDAVICIATYWDDAGVTPRGACRFQAKGRSIGRRGEPYVQPAYAWYTASWDLYGRIRVGYPCAFEPARTRAEPEKITYANGYGDGNCNTTLVDMGEVFDLLPHVATRYWIGPSVAGEYVAGGTILYVP